VDLEKTFDLLAGDVIWQVLEKFKIPKKRVIMIIGLT
jgi:hypothetical protein